MLHVRRRSRWTVVDRRRQSPVFRWPSTWRAAAGQWRGRRVGLRRGDSRVGRCRPTALRPLVSGSDIDRRSYTGGDIWLWEWYDGWLFTRAVPASNVAGIRLVFLSVLLGSLEFCWPEEAEKGIFLENANLQRKVPDYEQWQTFLFWQRLVNYRRRILLTVVGFRRISRMNPYMHNGKLHLERLCHHLYQAVSLTTKKLSFPLFKSKWEYESALSCFAALRQIRAIRRSLTRPVLLSLIVSWSCHDWTMATPR